MELKLNRQPLYINEVLLDTAAEQPVECDALLPDYCPDIVRILKCAMTPAIGSRRLNGQRLEMEGMANIVVYYISTAEGIYKAEFKVPFSKAVEMKGEPQNPVVTINARTGYVNCRAVNQRRLDIRGAVAITARVIHCREEQVVESGDGLGLQLRRQTFPATRILGQQNHETRLEETLELTYGKQPIQSILRCQAYPKVTECKASAGKAVLKGELALHVLYRSTAGNWEQMEFTIPTAVVIDIDGMDDQSLCDVCQELLSLNVEPAADGDGEYRNLSLDAMILSTVRAHGSYDAAICTDCYSTKNPCTFRTKNYSSLQLKNTMREQFSVKENMTLPENVEGILDLWCDVSGWADRFEQGSASMDGRLAISMLARMKDGEIYYFDKAMETSQRIPIDASNPVLDTRLTVTGCGFTFTANDTVEVRCDLVLEGSVYAPQLFTTVNDIVIDDKKPKDDLVSPGLYLYLAGDREPLWEIAKRYNTSINRIQEENPDQGDTTGKCEVLLIPVL